jgi:hypothetical protein
VHAATATDLHSVRASAENAVRRARAHSAAGVPARPTGTLRRRPSYARRRPAINGQTPPAAPERRWRRADDGDDWAMTDRRSARGDLVEQIDVTGRRRGLSRRGFPR